MAEFDFSSLDPEASTPGPEVPEEKKTPKSRARSKPKFTPIRLGKVLLMLQGMTIGDNPEFRWLIKRVKAGRKHPIDDLVNFINTYYPQLI
jgi:hypothetical protein